MVGTKPPIESAAVPPAQTVTASAEEEALKRNTDCVYFLASPLTCKKVAFIFSSIYCWNYLF